MTNEEAIEIIRVAIAEVEWDYPLDYAIAFNAAIEAIKKQIPMEHLPAEIENGRIIYPCGNCGSDVKNREYCSFCGQRVAW